MSEDASLSFMIAEYEAHHARAQSCVAAVTQHVSLFVGGITLLATAITGAAALLWSIRPKVALLIIASGFVITALGGALTLFATYRARLQQTVSEQALSRLRRYFLETGPQLRPYIFGSVNDDWKTPYSHPWTSNTVRAWLALIVFSSGAFGVGISLAMYALFGGSAGWLALLAGSSILGSFILLFSWLWSRLKLRRETYRPRFPATEAISNEPAV
jgi:hypothetical protein